MELKDDTRLNFNVFIIGVFNQKAVGSSFSDFQQYVKRVL